jgi:uncharacterized protein YqiB (DUF1249 family)
MPQSLMVPSGVCAEVCDAAQARRLFKTNLLPEQDLLQIHKVAVSIFLAARQ